MLSAAVKNELARVAGQRNVSFAREDVLAYSFDATGRMEPPAAVVFPSNAAEISEVIKLANKEFFGVVPRGAGSGFTGGSLPLGNAVVICTERMTRIIEIDDKNLTAHVEPGVITGNLQEEVEKLGLFYPPDPTSVKFSTIGGNIAECSGGPRGVKYGVTRDYVLGLDVVLPTGEVISTGVKKTLKGVVGYDLTRLMTGSEGTLGMITGAYLRLLPLPETVSTVYAAFPRLADAARAVTAIIGAKVVPSALELMDNASLRCVEDYAGMDFSGVGAALLIEVDGRREAVSRDAAEAERVVKECGAMEIKKTSNPKEAKELWAVRKAISPALRKIKPTKLNEDVVVPRTRIVELVEGVEGIAKARNVRVASFGHAGDGNIHVNIMIDGANPAEAEAGEAAVRDLFELTIALGGTISGEHGIGTAKAPYLSMELSGEAISAMRRIKDALDPNGIMNPGKIFTGERARNAVRA